MLYCRQHFFNMKIACLHSLLYTLLYYIPTTIVSHNNDHCIITMGWYFYQTSSIFPQFFLFVILLSTSLYPDLSDSRVNGE